MATKEAQINLRLSRELDQWVEEQAGGRRRKPAFIRELLERERAREQEREMQAMFDEAWEGLSEEERAEVRGEREEWLNAYAGKREGGEGG